jgi:hypothetical protein
VLTLAPALAPAKRRKIPGRPSACSFNEAVHEDLSGGAGGGDEALSRAVKFMRSAKTDRQVDQTLRIEAGDRRIGIGAADMSRVSDVARGMAKSPRMKYPGQSSPI